MDLLEVVKELVRFRTVTGNALEIDKCIKYITEKLCCFGAKVTVFRSEKASPVIFAANCDSKVFDVLVVGHIDVVPAEEKMFEPRFEDGKMYGRGTLDMKSFAAVALNSLNYVIKHKLPLKFGIIFSTDEEKGSKSLEAFLAANTDIKANVVLDNDVGGDVGKIIARCKNPVFVKICAKGEAAHGSTPWDGIDANENIMKTWANIRKIYPAYAKNLPMPESNWIDTVHFAKITGGDVANVISSEAEALLDFRLIETSSVEDLCRKLDGCMEYGVSYQVVSAASPVVMNENNPDIISYKLLAEEVLGQPVEFEYIGGATDSREFALRGSTVIMHSGSGDGMHAPGEYVEVETLKQIAEIQIKFLQQLAEKKK